MGPPVSNKKVCVKKNGHFLKMSHGGQLGPPLSDEKVCVTKNDHFLKIYAVLWRSVGTPLIQSEQSARGAKREVEKTLKFARPNLILARGSHPRPSHPKSCQTVIMLTEENKTQ